MDAVDQDALMSAGVAALQRVEAEVAPGPDVAAATYLRAPQALWRPADLTTLNARKLADVKARGREADVEGSIELSLLSAIVRLGKFSRGDTVKVRSYVIVDGEPRSLKVWSGFDERTSPGRRERSVRARIAGIEGYRSPPVIAEGRLDDGTEYVVEPVVYGRHPSTGEERLAAAADLGAALCEGYRATLVGHRRLSEATHPQFRARLVAALDAEDFAWPDTSAGFDRFRASLLRLVDRDRVLPVAATHGDLVASNVIRSSDGRHHLVDWEHGSTGPVAFDLVKLILTSGDPSTAIRSLSAATAGFDRRGIRRYRWTEQLALGLAQYLSWSQAGRVKAATVGRLDRFEAEQRDRIRLLSSLLADG